jgi:Domain of unknown function (DUF4279)
VHNYTVALRIEGLQVNTAAITKELGMAPTLTREVGGWRSPTTVWDKALWALDVYPESGAISQWGSLEAGIVALLKVFSPHAKTLQKYGQRHDVYLWCGHFSSGFCGGPEFSAGLLKSLGEFGVRLYLDTYLSSDDAET